MDLSSDVGTVPMVGTAYQEKLEKLHIHSVGDLVHHIPSRYLDYSQTKSIVSLQANETVTIEGTITSAISQYTRTGKQMQIVRIADETGAIEAIWFNQKYLLTTLKKGVELYVSGELKWFGRKKAFISPEYEIKSAKGNVHTGRLVPIYPETKGVSSKWLRSRIAAAFPVIKESLQDFYSDEVKKKYGLLSLDTALEAVHFPEKTEDTIQGVKRLAFDEMLFLQLRALLRKKKWQDTHQAYELKVTKKDIDEFTKALPFTLTDSQAKAIEEIKKDLEKPIPMNRLLEGDVGSGKTVIAAACCYIAFVNKKQSLLMAPTQILAGQHYKTLNELLTPMGIKVSLRTAAAKENDAGKADVIVGTQALIQKGMSVKDVAVVIIDEQHRFGVGQRDLLIKKGEKKATAPDVLTMTATPIPRTVALAAYGDLSLSTLDELPGGRKPITTWIVPDKKRKGANEWIDEQIAQEGVQVFVVCPLIEESDSEVLAEVKAAKVEFEEVKKAFPKRKVGLLHGKLKADEKTKILENFKAKKIDILVSTPVIEVGIDVPNATIMVIEGADRFGLAQLHQLRGRVGRGEKKSYCLLFSENTSERVQERLEAIKSAASGFELAEIDLQLRGPGELFGTRQSGFPELKIASWSDTALIKATKDLAEKIAENKKKYQSVYDILLFDSKKAT